MVVSLHPVPVEFDRASESIRAVEFRSDLRVQEIRAPEDLAPNSLALSADVLPGEDPGDSHYGTGRFILLHDVSEPEAWRGPFRVICFAQAPLETDIGSDGMLPEVAWAWLVDALADEGADYDHPSGTVTVVNSKGFGELAEQGEGSQIEMRASWSPIVPDARRDTAQSDHPQSGQLDAHVRAWSQLLCMLSGLPPVDSSDIPVLRPQIRQHGRS